MNRIDFIKNISLLGMSGAIFKLNALEDILSSSVASEKMPILFVGHGSPMNAIEDNEFSQSWKKLGEKLPKPTAIVCISAHWETKGTFVTAMPKPQTIHDFGGFPQALYDVQYPAPGSPELANEIKNTITTVPIQLDEKWGLDHGTWSIIRPMYPKADIPVIQISIDYTQSSTFHYELGKQLNKLRRKGVLIVGSGNMVHNLGKIAWHKMNEPEYGFDWALEANNKMKEFILSENHQALINFKNQGKAFDLAIPTPEHFIPLLYILGLKEKNEEIKFFNDKAVMGSLTMTSLLIN
ncbi:MAG: 4,5-DOPA dioxygenase extradiol [Bacteroidia bacterium]